MDKNSGQTNVVVIVIVVLVAVAGAIFAFTRSTNNTTQPVETNNNGQAMSNVALDLAPVTNPGQTGRANVTDEAGKTKVVIEVSPAGAANQPAGIYAGDCSNIGALKYTLNNVVNGRSETVLIPSMHFIHGLGQSVIAVHKSQEERSVYTSCGSLWEAFDKADHTGPASNN
ncbi:MAG TPA: hypothetical protein VEC17_01560 [Candidatus Binatia bacterium]|nr:hypothetical protein [Candidatus Binatia bacterium]